MASGNTLLALTPTQNEPPATGYATLDSRNSVFVLDFDDSAVESAVFRGVVPGQYAGGGFTVDLYWLATSATAGDAKWGVSAERDDPNHFDLDGDNFGTESTVTTTANATSGKVVKSSLTITHANLGSPDPGDPFRVKVRRLASDVADTMSGDAELAAVHVKES